MNETVMHWDANDWAIQPVQAHVVSHPGAQQTEPAPSEVDALRDLVEELARERDQLRADFAAAKRGQMILQSVCVDLCRQLRGRDETNTSTSVPTAKSVVASRALVAIAEPEHRLGPKRIIEWHWRDLDAAMGRWNER